MRRSIGKGVLPGMSGRHPSCSIFKQYMCASTRSMPRATCSSSARHHNCALHMSHTHDLGDKAYVHPPAQAMTPVSQNSQCDKCQHRP